MVRSLPEKTFEHWASMYVAHRFPFGGLWWPSFGEDVRVEDLGTVPGKSLLLEVKVPEQVDDEHVVTIDITQLRRYLKSIVPVYYAFPQPPWKGDLLDSGWLGIERRADLAYRRTGDRWFARWTWVCAAADLYHHLNPSPYVQTVAMSTPPPLHWLWRNFWRNFSSCGSDDLGSAFLLSGPPLVNPTREGLRNALGALRYDMYVRRSQAREEFLQELRWQEIRAYAPLEPGFRAYRELSRRELQANLSSIFDDDGADRPSRQEERRLAVCAIPFNALLADTK